MNKRLVLSRLIRGMLAILVLAFLFILFRSLGGPSITTGSDGVFDNVVIGQTVMRRVGSRRVWVTRVSKLQVRQAELLDANVIDSKAGCRRPTTLCAIDADSIRSGIDIVYSPSVPAQLPKGVAWYGGFVDPASGALFDILGRAYKGIDSNDERTSLKVVAY